MERRLASLLPLSVGALVGPVAGCSLSTYDVTPCTSNAECQAAFGWGSVCVEATQLCGDADLLARCDRSYPADLLSDREAYRDSIVFGAVLDRAALELEMLSFELPFVQANQDSEAGLDGRDFALIECTNEENTNLDNLDGNEASVAVATWLADDIGVSAILGPDYSSATADAFQAVEPFGTLVISHSATSPALTTLDGATHSDEDPGLLWRTVPPDSLQGQVIADDMGERGVSKVAVIYESGAYGEGLADEFGSSFEGGAGRTVDRYLFQDDSQLSEYVVDVGGLSYDEVLFIASDLETVKSFLRAAGVLTGFDDGDDGTPDPGIFLTDGAYYAEIYQETSGVADQLFDQIRGTRPTIDEDSQVYAAFRAAFSSTYSGADPADSAFSAHAFDAAWLVLYGSAWSQYQTGAISGLGIAKGLRKVSEGTPVDIRSSSFGSVKTSFAAGNSIDVTGASGLLDFDPITGETTAPIEVWAVVPDGSSWGFESLETVQP